jgi:hypothetical protein
MLCPLNPSPQVSNRQKAFMKNNTDTESTLLNGQTDETDLDAFDSESSAPYQRRADYFPLVFAAALLSLFLLIQPDSLSGIGKVFTRDSDIKRKNIGTVQKITYVGGFAYATQIETEHTTLLLNGSANLQKGDRLERREWSTGVEICNQVSHKCWDLRSH